MQLDLVVTNLPLAVLVPYAENARTHSDTQVGQIADSIREFGFVNPVLVDADGVLIAGHGRVLAAKRLGLATVPVLRLGHLSPAQARALRLPDMAALRARFVPERAALPDATVHLTPLTAYEALLGATAEELA